MRKFSPLNRSRGLLLAGMFALGVSVSAQTSIQPFMEWGTTAGTQHDFQHAIVRSKSVSGTTYYYTCGSTINSSGNYDILLQKKDSYGNVLWSQTYNGLGNGNDYGTDVQITSGGMVYVCGSYYKNSTDSNNAIILKYNNAGVQQWAFTFNGAGSRHDAFAAMQLSTNTLVAVGTTWTSTTLMYDMLAVRVDTNGNSVWNQTWDYANLNDGAINLWNSGTKLYIAGGAQSATTTYKYAVVNLKFSDGTIQGSTVTGGTAFGFDQVTDLKMDGNTYIYVTGSVNNTGTGYDYKTIKYDTALNVIWSASYSGSGSYADIATGLYLDSLGNVIVTGYSNTSTQNKDYATVKYNSSGTQQWVATYNGSANGSDSAAAVVTLGTDIYVTGSSFNGSSNDYCTIKYNSSGTQQWVVTWNSTPNYPDRATAITTDTLRRIIVAGQTADSVSQYSYMTICYAELSTIIPPDTVSAGSRAFLFTENRGQLRDLSFNSDTKAQYYCQSTSPQVYFRDDSKVSLQLCKIDTVAATTDSVFEVDMTFSGANKVPARACNESTTKSSFYLSHIPDGAVWINSYENVVYHNLYSNIDLEFGSHSGGVKHSYIIKPGGDPTDIDIVFTGQSSLSLTGNTLSIATSLGNIDFPQACAYQIDGSGNFDSLNWQPTYSISSSHVKFTNIGSYDTTKILVIVIRVGLKNPAPASNGNLEWCSYGGTTQDDYFYDACRVVNGEVAVGFTMFTGFSGSPGGFTGIYSGSQDGIMMYYEGDLPKFHCYIGGTGGDNINAVCLNGNDTSNAYIYFAGGGSSTGQSPHCNFGGGLTQSYGGGYTDAYIGCIDASFGLQFPWFSYLGGSNGESIKDIFWDAGNLYFTGLGGGGTPLKTETGAYNSSTGTMLLGKFNYADSLTWSTRFGSGWGNAIYHRNNWLVVAGTATVSDLPIFVPSSWLPYVDSVRNGNDAFFAQFDAADHCNWSTYYGGTSAETCEGIAVDRNNDIYLCGSTSSGDFPFKWQGTTNGYIDSAIAGSGDAFMAKFNSIGHRIWASYYGGSSYDHFNEVLIDSLNNVYFLGTTSSTNASMLNAGSTVYNQTTIGDNLANPTYGDGVIMMLNPALDRKWCTYFGGNNPDFLLGGSISEQYPQTLVLAGAAQSTASFPWYGTNAITTNADPSGAFYDGYEARMTLTNILVLSTPEDHPTPENNILLYPNPSTGQITLQLETGTTAAEDLIIYNSLGQMVYEDKQPQIDAAGRIYIDLSTLGNGVYFLNLQSGEAVKSAKFTITR